MAAIEKPILSPKKVLCVFAHPDDESLGPGGTIALWAKNGAIIHEICATKGEAGENKTAIDTAFLRTTELKKAAKILGIQKIHYFGYKDGKLCNTDLGSLTERIVVKIKKFLPDVVMTFDLNGVSGHLDHIAVSSATTNACKKTKIAKKLYYFTNHADLTMQMEDYFISFPQGRTDEQMDEIIDASSVWEKRMAAMYAHASQVKDVERFLPIFEGLGKKEHFMVLSF